MSTQLHGRGIYPVDDASSSDEDIKDPAPESYLDLSDEECSNGRNASFLYTLPKRHNKDGEDVRTRSGRLYEESDFNPVKPKIISTNRCGDGTKRKPLSHSQKLSNYARRNPSISKPELNQGPVIKLPYVSKGGDDYRTRSRKIENLTKENLPYENGNHKDRLQVSAISCKSPDHTLESSPSSKTDQFLSRGALSSSGYSSLSGNGSFSSSTSSASFTTSSSPVVTSSDNSKLENVDTKSASGTKTEANLNSEKEPIEEDPESEDVFPLTTWLESAEFSKISEKYESRTCSNVETDSSVDICADKSDTISETTKSISSKSEVDSSHLSTSSFDEPPKSLVAQNIVSMVEKPEPAKVKRRNSNIGGSVKLRVSRSKKNEAARNSLLFAYQNRGATEGLSNLLENTETAPDLTGGNRNTLTSPLKMLANHCEIQRPLSATSPSSLRSYSDKTHSPVAQAIHRRMSELSVSSRDDSGSLSTQSSATENSSPSKRTNSTSSLNPPPQPLGKPPRLQRKPSLKNRLKGAFSFQNLRKAISTEKIDEEERLKSISNSYLNERGEDIANIPVPRHRGRPQSISGGSGLQLGSLYKPPSIGSMFGSVRMRSKKIRERRAIVDRNSIACDPKPKPLYDYPSLSKKPPLQKQNQDDPDNVGVPAHFRPIGRVLHMNVREGTMLIEMIKPSSGPFGFYVAKNDSGIAYVSSLSDSYPDKMFAGLMKTGDQIIEINSQKVNQLHLDQIYDLILENERLIIKTKPAAAVDAT